MKLEFYKKSFKNNFFLKGMNKDTKKLETAEMDSNIANYELKEILERKDPEHINKDFMIDILNKIKGKRKIGQKEIAKMILFMADFPERNWNIKSIMEGMKTNLEEVNWRDVYSCFLEEDFNIWSLDSLYVIIDCWVCISGIITVPYEIFFKKWKNPRSQIYFIRLIIESDEKKTQLYSNVFFNKIVKLEETRNSRFKNSLIYESTFNCVELFQCIKQLDSNILIEQIAKKAPEWCLAGLSYVYPSFEKFFDELMLNFLRGSSSNFIFYILFRNIQKIIMKKFPKYMASGISLSKILDVILEQKMLPMVSDDLEPPNMCLDIIILSSVRDHLNLGIWMNNNLASKKDSFAKILLHYVDYKIQGIIDLNNNTEQEGNNKSNNLMIDKLFPLTVEMILNFMKSIEQYQKQLSFEILTQFNQLKKQIPQVIKMKKGMENSVDEQASTFISSIINSQLSITEGIESIKSMQKGDVSSKELSFKIFSTLIENYSALYKLPNSDLLAIFYGELIKNDIIPKPFLKVALGYIKESLTYPETDREFHFAFKCLEIFIRSMPKFLTEIENIEVVKNNLLKKDLILVDENFYTKLEFYEIIEICYKVMPNQELIKKYYDLKIQNESRDFEFLENITNEDFNLLLINFIYTEDIHVILKMLNFLKNESKMEFVYACLNMLKTLLNFQIEDEINFVKKIGTVTGKLILACNRMVVLDKFDFKKFLLNSIECRRIFLGVSFICTFLRQGKYGKIFIPKNPWLMSLLNLLGDLHTCTLKKVRSEIESIFTYFKLPLNQRPIRIYKFKTRDYLLEYKLKNEMEKEDKYFSGKDNFNNKDSVISRDMNDKNDVLKHVISLALDFSIREIAEVIIEKACEIAIKTGTTLFKTIKVEKGTEFTIFRNLLINLTKSLCYVSAQEPMRACMSGNITYFLKLVGLEITPEEILEIVNDNQDLCCNLIQRAGVSKINDCISDYYKNTEINSGMIANVDLKILENNTHVGKVIIKPIDSSEYQELKSHFLQISRKKNVTDSDFISEEWHNLLGNKSEEDFKRIKNYICKSEDKDIECTKLCKYIIGHLIKSTQDNSSDFLFFCLKEIFKISNRTQKEVLSWIIYSTDVRRFNLNFVSKFIEFQLLNLVEYDQALARSIKSEENLDPILNLVNNLITGEVQICTVYDFIALLEALANNSDNTKIYDFFQKISNYMMLFDNSNVTDFDEFVKSEKYNIFLDCKKNRSLPKNINIRAALKSSWEHFVRHHKIPTLFCYQKIDMIPLIIKNSLGLYIKDTLEVFIDAYKRRNYLFAKFYTRFLLKLLDNLDETPENIRIIHDVLILLKPSSVPFFTSGYLEIIQHKFVRIFFDFYMAEEVLKVLNINDKFLYPCTIIFMNIKDNKSFFKMYGIYLSYICNYKYVHLKNIFNRYRDNIQCVDNQNLYFKVRKMLQSNTIVIKDYVNKSNFLLYLIDNLNEKNLVTVYASNILRTYINEKMFIQKIIALVWIYNKCEFIPIGVKTFYDELRKNEWVMKIIESIDVKFNK